MAQYNHISFVLLLFFSSWCYPKSMLIKHDDYIKIVIQDFLRSSPLRNKDCVFGIIVKEFEHGIIGISVYGSTRKPAVLRNGDGIDFSSLPTKYIEMNGKLFYWHDKEISVTEDMIMALKKYNFLDTAILNVYIPPFTIDDDKKGEHYYFCKCNLKILKKVITNKKLGGYSLPRMKCRL